MKRNSIPANHMNMCKYASETDIGYERTSTQIVSLVKQAMQENASSELLGIIS